MKLKTELTNEQPFGRHVRWKETGDLYHDAAMAHALVMALATCPEHLAGSNAVRWVTATATDHMREWGYTED